MMIKLKCSVPADKDDDRINDDNGNVMTKIIMLIIMIMELKRKYQQ